MQSVKRVARPGCEAAAVGAGRAARGERCARQSVSCAWSRVRLERHLSPSPSLGKMFLSVLTASLAVIGCLVTQTTCTEDRGNVWLLFGLIGGMLL